MDAWVRGTGRDRTRRSTANRLRWRNRKAGENDEGGADDEGERGGRIGVLGVSCEVSRCVCAAGQRNNGSRCRPTLKWDTTPAKCSISRQLRGLDRVRSGGKRAVEACPAGGSGTELQFCSTPGRGVNQCRDLGAQWRRAARDWMRGNQRWIVGARSEIIAVALAHLRRRFDALPASPPRAPEDGRPRCGWSVPACSA